MAIRNVTINAGISGYGKSTFVLRYLVNAPLVTRFIFDPFPGEFNPYMGEFADRLKLEPADDHYSLAKALCRGWVAFDPSKLFPGDLEGGFNFFCEWAMAKSMRIPGEKVIVVDEVWMYCTNRSIPKPLATIAQMGRKTNRGGLRLMVNTQQPNNLPQPILNQVSEYVSFRLQEEHQLNAVERFGFKRDEISRLDQLQFVSRNLDSGGELRGRIKL